MKKIFLTTFALIMCVISLTACSRVDRPREFYIADSFDMVIPEGINFANVTRLYMKNTQEPPFGDGEHYSVLEFQSEPTEFLAAEFTKSTEKEIYEEFKTFRIPRVTKEVDVPPEFLPDWNQEYYWKFKGKGELFKDRNFDPPVYDRELYLIYQPHSMRLIVCANFV